MNITVIIATHGDNAWKELAWSRAYPSTIDQGAGGVLVRHEPRMTLAEVRNAAAGEAQGDWLCFLDADDELADGYLEAIDDERMGWRSGPWRLFAPRVQFVRPDGSTSVPGFPNRQAPMDRLNHCIIGTLVPRRLFLEVGGFRELPAYEDWDLFLRCIRAGATIVDVPGAVYRAFTHPGRNSQPRKVLERAYRMIRDEHLAAVA